MTKSQNKLGRKLKLLLIDRKLILLMVLFNFTINAKNFSQNNNDTVSQKSIHFDNKYKFLDESLNTEFSNKDTITKIYVNSEMDWFYLEKYCNEKKIVEGGGKCFLISKIYEKKFSVDGEPLGVIENNTYDFSKEGIWINYSKHRKAKLIRYKNNIKISEILIKIRR